MCIAIGRDLLRISRHVEDLEDGNAREDRTETELASQCAQLRTELDAAHRKIAVLWLERKAANLNPNGWADDDDQTHARPSPVPAEPEAATQVRRSEPPLPRFTLPALKARL